MVCCSCFRIYIMSNLRSYFPIPCFLLFFSHILKEYIPISIWSAKIGFVLFKSPAINIESR